MEASHVAALQAKHEGLDARLKAEQSRPFPDMTIIQTIKKQKLQLKQAFSAT